MALPRARAGRMGEETMIGRSLILALGAALLFGLAGQAGAAERMKGKDVIVTGCVYQPLPTCTKIDSGKTVYVLHDAKPPIPNNTGVTLVGTRTGDVDICFGIPLKVLKWKQNKLHCPPR
jgi:hypothetical protein